MGIKQILKTVWDSEQEEYREPKSSEILYEIELEELKEIIGIPNNEKITYANYDYKKKVLIIKTRER